MWQISPLEIEIVIKLVLSAILGVMVGFEREIHGKPAGLRTHVMVCVGAALFSIVSYMIGSGEPSRIAAGIVTGIGFLGAGMIFHTENRITGLTTAAELWVLGAIGMSVGFGMYFAAIATTLLVMFVLAPGKILETKMDKKIRKR